MSLIPSKWSTKWRVEGVTLFGDNNGKIKPEDRNTDSTTHLHVFAATASEAEEAFAKAYVADVRVTKVERL